MYLSMKIIHSEYSDQSHSLQKIDSTKYLGVTIKSNLKWDKHINKLLLKPTRPSVFYTETSKFTARKSKTLLINPLSGQSLNNHPVYGTPQHQIRLINQLKKVQQCAARYTCNRYHNTSSVSDMITDLDWPLLKTRWLRAWLIMFYKIVHFQVALYPTDLLYPTDPRTRHANPNCYKYIQTNKDISRVERKTIVTQTYFWNPCLGATWTPL